MSRKVLIIAHLDHASPRIPSLAQHLREFGWQPVILTAPSMTVSDSHSSHSIDRLKNIKIIETSSYLRSPERNGALAEAVRSRVSRDSVLWHTLRTVYRAFNTVYHFLQSYYLEWRWYPDRERAWIPCVLDTAERFFATENVDLIISTSSPVSAHIACSQIQRKHDIPWIADLRDLWTQNHNYSHSIVRRTYERRLEKRTLSRASALVTISDEWVSQLRLLHTNIPAYSIKNGYNPASYLNRVKLTDRFCITYTGQIYPAQHPKIFFDAIKDLLHSNVLDKDKFVIRFFGPQSPILNRYASIPQLRDVLELHGIIPFREIARRQMESHLLLLLNWGNRRGSGCYPLKTFEYLGACRPIIATGGCGNDVVERLIESTRAGVYCRSKSDIIVTIERFYREYEQYHDVLYKGLLSETKRFSYRELSRQYASLLDNVCNLMQSTTYDTSE